MPSLCLNLMTTVMGRVINWFKVIKNKKHRNITLLSACPKYRNTLRIYVQSSTYRMLIVSFETVIFLFCLLSVIIGSLILHHFVMQECTNPFSSMIVITVFRRPHTKCSHSILFFPYNRMRLSLRLTTGRMPFFS